MRFEHIMRSLCLWSCDVLQFIRFSMCDIDNVLSGKHRVPSSSFELHGF